jgi:lipoprotein-anchoring transpeptidase ErfK/SrfK
MKPFAYEQPRRKNYSKLILILLAGASFSIWHFDLFPQLASIDTGRLDSDEQSDDADFLAMLESPTFEKLPDTNPILDHRTGDQDFSDSADATLLAALASQSEPIENSFPEFAGVRQAKAGPVDMTEPGAAQQPSSGIQQAAFANVEPSLVTPAISSAVVLDSETAATLRTVDEKIEAGETLEPHALLSELYWKQPAVRSMIQERLEKTAAEIYANPDAHFAKPYEVQFGETLDGIAAQFDVPWQYLARLNGVTPETLQAGQSLKVLKGPFGAVVDLQRFEMTLIMHGWYVRSYKIGIGRDQQTPTGEFTVQNKLENPTWYNPSGGVLDGDDPSNPLGEYWLGLGEHIGIHGTIDPSSIGAASSRGCIHLADDDIAEVYQLLGVGSKVVIRNR